MITAEFQYYGHLDSVEWNDGMDGIKIISLSSHLFTDHLPTKTTSL